MTFHAGDCVRIHGLPHAAAAGRVLYTHERGGGRWVQVQPLVGHPLEVLEEALSSMAPEAFLEEAAALGDQVVTQVALAPAPAVCPDAEAEGLRRLRAAALRMREAADRVLRDLGELDPAPDTVWARDSAA
jgi:hypothetical protein